MREAGRQSARDRELLKSLNAETEGASNSVVMSLRSGQGEHLMYTLSIGFSLNNYESLTLTLKSSSTRLLKHNLCKTLDHVITITNTYSMYDTTQVCEEGRMYGRKFLVYVTCVEKTHMPTFFKNN